MILFSIAMLWLTQNKRENGVTEEHQEEITSLSDPKQEAQDILKSLKGDLSYALEDVPPWYTSVVLGFQVSSIFSTKTHDNFIETVSFLRLL